MQINELIHNEVAAEVLASAPGSAVDFPEANLELLLEQTELVAWARTEQAHPSH